MKLIYVESQIIDHRNTIKIIEKFPNSKIIEINHYGEIVSNAILLFELSDVLSLLSPTLLLKGPFEHCLAQLLGICFTSSCPELTTN